MILDAIGTEQLVRDLKRASDSVAFWKADSAAAWDKCEEHRKVLDAVWGELTELMNLWDRYLGVADPARMVGNCDITDQIEKIRGLVAEELKP